MSIYLSIYIFAYLLTDGHCELFFFHFYCWKDQRQTWELRIIKCVIGMFSFIHGFIQYPHSYFPIFIWLMFQQSWVFQEPCWNRGFQYSIQFFFLFWSCALSIFCILNFWIDGVHHHQRAIFCQLVLLIPKYSECQCTEIPHLLGFFLFSLISSIPFGICPQ